MRSLRILFAAACVASLAMSSSANAAMILSFGIGTGPGTKTASVSGSTTTLSTNSAVPLFGGAFPVSITTIGNVTLPPILSISAKETFTGVASTGAATNVGGTISQPFSGVISYLDPTNPAINYLTITFAGVLRGSTGGLSASLTADNTVAGQSVSFTSTDVRVIPFLADPIKIFEVGLTGLSAPLAISGTTIAGFTTSNESGNVSSFPIIPEPASIVMASTAVLAGLGCFGWRRYRSA
jgi:hypothetical protein